MSENFTIGAYTITSQKAYEALKKAGITSDTNLKKLDTNSDMQITENELIEITGLEDDSETATSSAASTGNSAQNQEAQLLYLYEKLDGLIQERARAYLEFGDADENSSSDITSLNSEISNIRKQIYQTYLQMEVPQTNYTAGVANTGTTEAGGTYTYSGNSTEFVNKFNNSSFSKGVLAGKGEMVASIAEKYGIDPNLLASIMALETGWGTSSAIKNYNNPGGMMDPSTNWMSLKHYSSLQEGIEAVAKNLKNNYIDKGLTTISSIGAKYCPVGAANDPNGTNSGWVPSVTKIYNMLTGANIGSNTKLA